MRTRSQTTLEQEEAISTSMEARLAAMEQLVERLTVEVGVPQEENKSLKETSDDLGHNAEPNNNEHVGSKNARGEGVVENERRNMQNNLRNLKGKYEEMSRNMSTSSLVG